MPAQTTPLPFPNIDTLTLDEQQARYARDLGSGHRLVYGVAGSGKTVMLLARARYASERQPHHRILVLCYNVSLAACIQHRLRGCSGVDVHHFDEWSKRLGVSRDYGEENEELGHRLLSVIGRSTSRSVYDSVLIDEAQDFAPTWFQCVLATMKDPDNGDLLIVSDGNQGVYRRKKVLWKALGVHASGRVVRMKPAKLDSNYRNTREIIALAADFATLTSSLDDDEMQIVPPDPSKCTRSIREKPVLYGESHRKAECQRVCKIVRGLLNGEWNGHALHAPLAPSEIAVLYPMLPAPSRNEFHDFLKDLRKIAPVIWLTDDKARQNRRKVAEDGIKVQTIHSAKGLEYRAVVVLWAAFLPCTFTPDLDEQRDRILMYVAMTRAKDYLAMTFSKGSRFITKIHHSGATEPARWN